MMQNRPSIAGVDERLAFASRPDLEGQLEHLARELKDSPLNERAKQVFEDAAALVGGIDANETSVSPHLAMCLLFISRYRCYNGDAYAGLEPAARAMCIAERCGDKSLYAKAAKLLGVVYLETGNHPGAVAILSQALPAAKAAKDVEQQVGILSNLGLAYQYSGHFSQAIPCYERANEIFMEAKESGVITLKPQYKAAALSNLALACLNMSDYGRGIRAAEEVAQMLETPKDLHEGVIRVAAEYYLTRLLVEVRSVDAARDHAGLAGKYAAGTTDTAQMFADMAQGLVEVYEPDSRNLGLKRLEGVVDRSRRGAATFLRDALATIVRAYEMTGQPNAALVYLYEIQDLNRKKRIQDIVLHHRRHVKAVDKRRRQDRAAQKTLDAKFDDLIVQRLSVDALKEYLKVLEQNTVSAEMHDDETGEHCYRVGALSRELALLHGIDPETCVLIDLSARLHDIGKLAVPDSILLKPGRFTAGERAIMQAHTTNGRELIANMGMNQLFVAEEIALNHHERWDGNGYPSRRQGTMIPLTARITALADVFDALTHQRCYKPAWSVEDALREIASLRGKHFDPELTDEFLALMPQLQARHGNLDAYLGAAASQNNFIAGREQLARELKTQLGTFDVGR